MLGVFCTMVSGKVSAAAKSLSRVRLLATPWTATHQAPPSMGFSRQEYWSGVPLPSAGRVSKKVKLQYLMIEMERRELIWTVLKVKSTDVRKREI